MSSSASDSEDTEIARPNRWTGAPSTWQFLTEQERGLANSLDKLRDQDLSIHLYNAFALKKRAAKFRESKGKEAQTDNEELAVDIEDETDNADDVGQEWAPPKSWTAWPLPPGLVPRDGEQIGPEDGNDPYTFLKAQALRPSRDLEEILVGITLKEAKESFEGRDWAERDEEQLAVDLDNEDRQNDGGNAEPLIKEASQPPTESKFLRPVVSADDDRSRKLLRPSIRHTLSQLDDALMALHHSRETCFHYASQSEATTDDETRSRTSSRSRASSIGSKLSKTRDLSTGSKRPKGRPRKYHNLPSGGSSPAREQDEGGHWRIKTTIRGRPKKQYPRMEGETPEEYDVRVARLQKKPLPAFAPPIVPKSPEPQSSPADKPTKKIPAKRSTPEELAIARQKKLRPRDWSEVLGAAALVGFPTEVIARATQRCATLFGESMTMRTIVETPYAKQADIETRYEPELIPELPSESSSDELEDARPSSGVSRPSRIQRLRPSTSRTNENLCPLQNCPRRLKGFRNRYDLLRHLSKAHKMTDIEIEDVVATDTEIEGGVHVDGFLRPLKNARPRREKSKESKKRRRRGTNSSSEEDMAYQSSRLDDGED